MAGLRGSLSETRDALSRCATVFSQVRACDHPPAHCSKAHHTIKHKLPRHIIPSARVLSAATPYMPTPCTTSLNLYDAPPWRLNPHAAVGHPTPCAPGRAGRSRGKRRSRARGNECRGRGTRASRRCWGWGARGETLRRWDGRRPGAHVRGRRGRRDGSGPWGRGVWGFGAGRLARHTLNNWGWDTVLMAAGVGASHKTAEVYQNIVYCDV